MANAGTENTTHHETGLILSGGGARASYQVGVLMAIADILPDDSQNPFGIICGVSAGAVNATALATHANHFRTGIRGLERIWGNIAAGQIYRTDLASIIKSIIEISWSTVRGGTTAVPISLLDNEPLGELLSMVINFKRIQRAIDQGNLRALSITASGYDSSKSISFYQGTNDISDWHRAHRSGIRANLNVDHLMASTAIPLVFPAKKIKEEYYGDGAIRQLSPVSPALHLGAKRILVIGVSNNRPEDSDTVLSPEYPSIAKIMGHVWNASFVDALEGDVERLERINRTLGLIPEENRHGTGLKMIDLLKIYPSEPLDEIAARHARDLPASIRLFLRGSGATKTGGSSLLSYILFEQKFCRELMLLGYNDALEREDDIRRFFAVPEKDRTMKWKSLATRQK